MPFDIRGDMRLLLPVDARHQRNAELAEVDAPQHHARLLSRIGIVDAKGKPAAELLDV
jgi:hypothetical protein